MHVQIKVTIYKTGFALRLVLKARVLSNLNDDVRILVQSDCAVIVTLFFL